MLIRQIEFVEFHYPVNSPSIVYLLASTVLLFLLKRLKTIKLENFAPLMLEMAPASSNMSVYAPASSNMLSVYITTGLFGCFSRSTPPIHEISPAERAFRDLLSR
jgi:hypothetical protein